MTDAFCAEVCLGKFESVTENSKPKNPQGPSHQKGFDSVLRRVLLDLQTTSDLRSRLILRVNLHFFQKHVPLLFHKKLEFPDTWPEKKYNCNQLQVIHALVTVGHFLPKKHLII